MTTTTKTRLAASPSRATTTGGRRGHGEGSIYLVAGGKWRAVVDLGWQDGKRQRKYASGATRVEVAGKLRAMLHDIDQGRTPGREVTVEQHLRRWVTESLPGRVAPAALANYGSVVRNHLIPAIGRRRLSQLTPADVERLLNAKQASGLSNSTVRRIRSVLVQALRQAEKWGMVARNVASLVDPPKDGHQEEQRSLTLAEARALLSAARGTRMEAPTVLLLATGLRRGELLGLQWGDVDLDAAVLRVRRAYVVVGGKASLEDAKTPKSRRALNLAAPVVDTLRRHRATQAAASSWVFASTAGTPWNPRNFSRSFDGLVKAAGLAGTGVHPHTTRHTAASTMLAGGVPVESVMSVLGHTSPRMTLGTYSHVEAPARQAAAETLAGALGLVPAPLAPGTGAC